MKKFFSTLLVLLMLSVSICMPVQAASKKDKYYSRNVFNEYSYKIPDLNTTFVPQGLCKITYNKKEYRLITAYDYNNKKDSRIYIMDSNGKRIKTVDIRSTKGQHVGGITEYNNQIWIVSTKKIFIIEKKDLFDKNYTVKTKVFTNKDISTDKNIPKELYTLNGNFSFCTTSHDGKYIWIGSYVDKGMVAYANAFSYNKNKNKLVHYAAMSIPTYAQGMCFDSKGKKVYISGNDGLSSYIEINNIKGSSSTAKIGRYTYRATFKFYDTQVKTTIKAPAGIEEIYLNNSGNLYAIFEMGSKAIQDKWHNLPKLAKKLGLMKIENRVVLIDLTKND